MAYTKDIFFSVLHLDHITILQSFWDKLNGAREYPWVFAEDGLFAAWMKFDGKHGVKVSVKGEEKDKAMKGRNEILYSPIINSKQ